jgi:hypothetical protein
MKQQGITGQSTEQKVRGHLKSIGLEAEKPKRDIGVDLEVWYPGNFDKKVFVQVKGRGKLQKNGRYRWFQIRTTEKQRNDAVKSRLPVCDAWQLKVNLCDFFVLVSEKHEEYWVFPSAIIHEIVNLNKSRYSSRKDNISGEHAEMDLDIESRGRPLTEIYELHRNNFTLIQKKLKSASH